MKCTQFVFTLILAFIVGCSGGGHSGAKKDAGQDGGCDPDCHVDCFGGVFCEAGELWVNAFGAKPCCSWDDSDFSLDCRFDEITSCDNGCLENVSENPRYMHVMQECFEGIREPNVHELAHLYPYFCEASLKLAGMTCYHDEHCRPSADENRLVCDLVVSKCVIAFRPVAPIGFGEHCGLENDRPGSYEDIVVSGVTCEWCHVLYDGKNECLRQACTIPCKLDEDCPEGSHCLCLGYIESFIDEPYQVCVRTEDYNQSSRREWLSCE